MANATEASGQTFEQWRTSMFREMGFEERDAETLSEYRNEGGWLIDTHAVRRMLDNGCSVDLAMKILL